MTPIPFSLYIHFPWCVKKCPYCDFNSHLASFPLPEQAYITALLQDLDHQLDWIAHRPISSIFLGGGTPSLFSGKSLTLFLHEIKQRCDLQPQAEITIEANPGTIDQGQFDPFRSAGINRLSLGAQSFQNDKLSKLGRIHSAEHVFNAIQTARAAGLTNINLDLIYGLPQQSIEDALYDLNTAIQCNPTHLSWYQLTIEPNTLFYHFPPQALPDENTLWAIQKKGQRLLKQAGFKQYEVSAYSKNNMICLHNVHYWQFGDYLGIGAGAHSKLTHPQSGLIYRRAQMKHPIDYLNLNKHTAHAWTRLNQKKCIFEFMLNTQRLTQGVETSLFYKQTGIPLSRIEPLLKTAYQKGLLHRYSYRIRPTALGRRFLNDLISLFL